MALKLLIRATEAENAGTEGLISGALLPGSTGKPEPSR